VLTAVLSPEQVQTLRVERQLGRTALGGGDGEIDMSTFMGMPIEEAAATPGVVVVAVDGVQTQL
jgi:hypothetical protein